LLKWCRKTRSSSARQVHVWPQAVVCVAETDFLIKNGSIMTAKQIAEALGRTEYAVMERSRYIGGVMRKSGKNHHNHKYSDWDVEMCRKLHDEGIGPKEISDKLDIGYDSVIDFICYRRR